ncbi:MAG TPA: carboxypeptidase regulatory-like domain-containing protein [Candidatus Cybelea sp.]|nr:carboxypeptidase regulatory-like domain-containing protein [Candidatus Cybelea sp.]
MNKKYFGFMALLGVVVLALGLAIAGSVSAQIVSGDFVGTVLDKTGAVVPKAAVEATNADTGVKYAATANEAGEYRFNNLPVGTYNVSASSPNFATTTINGFKVELNKTSTLQITLEIKGASTTVEVSGVAQALDTTTAQLSTTFEEKQMADLPTASVGLGVLNLSLLSSGVASSGGIGAGTGPSVGGQRPRNNNFTVEGVDNNNKTVTGPLITVPNDAVAEFSFLQNQFSPDFGHSSGGQFNQVIKSGTNSYHGLAYIYDQNRNYNAVDQSTRNNGFTSNQRFDNNRMGGTFGGPILKNKLFFFGNLEYNPVGQATVLGSAICTPTAAGYTALAGAPGVSATNLQILQKYAVASSAPNNICGAKATPGSEVVDGVTVPEGVLKFAGPNYSDSWVGLGSIDYDLSAKDQLRGRYIYNRFVGIDTSANLPAFYQPLPQKFHLIAINEYHTFGPSLQNEARVGYNRFTNVTSAGNFSFPGLDSFPNIVVSSLHGINIGPDPNAPQFTIQNTYNAADSLTWTKDKHTLKFGIEGRKYISPQSFTQRARGDYEYNTLQQYLNDISPDIIAQRSVGQSTYYGDQSALYWFVNDNWRLRPNLSVNLGVRYEYTTIPFGERSQVLNNGASDPGLLTFGVPQAAKNNWGPRVGLAYSPGTSGRTSIRAGFGIAYDVLYDNIGILSLPPQLSVTENSAPKANTANFLKNGGLPPGTGGITNYNSSNPKCAPFVTNPPNEAATDVACARAFTTTAVAVNQLDPKSLDWTLGVQHTFWKDYTVEARYVGTRGIHLNVQSIITLQPVTTPALHLPTYTNNVPSQAVLDASTVNLGILANGDNLVPAFEKAGFTNALTDFLPEGASTYHGLATQITRRFSNGLQFVGAYTYSHLIDNSTADFHSTDITPRRPQDFQNLATDRSNSALDHRHRFTLALLYDEPFFKHGNWLAKNALGNWEIAPIYTYQSGEWGTVQSGVDANLNGDSASDRSIWNASGVANTGSDVVPLCTSAIPSDAGVCTLGNALNNKATSKNPKYTGQTFDVIDNLVGYQAVNPNAQYIRAYYGALANVGRDTLRLPAINNFDATAVKRFSFSERYKAEFSVQAFNLLNHPQFIAGSLNQVNSIGVTGSPRTMFEPYQTTFNNPSSVFPSNARSLQLALKIFF